MPLGVELLPDNCPPTTKHLIFSNKWCTRTRAHTHTHTHSQMLSYGCTRLEIGVQSVYEDVARDTNRGHTVRAVCESFQLAKDAGFKVVAHMMPDLPNVGLERDIEGFIVSPLTQHPAATSYCEKIVSRNFLRIHHSVLMDSRSTLLLSFVVQVNI